MIKFRQLKYKNFLSTGNSFTTVNLELTKSSLIVGQNGSGKSTMLDALSFALFGKAHRNVNKPQLVNSVNGKDCVVEVEFHALGMEYRILRGLKPAKFEIWQDGVMINQDSHAKEYQKVLEQNILKLNHKSFHQIVVLGSSSFIPFMQLPASHRREVIEDLLDINVFSKMNTVLKEKINTLKDSIRENEHTLELSKAKIDTQEDHIFELEKISESAKSKYEDELKEQQAELARLEKLVEGYTDTQMREVEKLLFATKKQIDKLEKFDFQFDQKIKKFDKDVKFYEDNDTCPTCDQEIAADTKSKKIRETFESKGQVEDGKHKLSFEIAKHYDEMTRNENILSEETSKFQDVEMHRRDISRLKREIQNLSDELSAGGQDMDSLQTAKSTLEDLRRSREKIVQRKMELAEEREYNNVITEMLKDSGIKTKIIKQYLPVINKLTNQYLQVLDFYVHFDLDEGFNETIRSRHRDAFSYSSFSEGEKQRIDLALLFTWRQVAKMKNSVATNLLVLDETFDSSLDADGVENLLKILDTLDDETNVFIISHKGELLDNKFERKIEFTKSKNFSKIT
jgi:DNA repair exonuclease SbcCD ATPase subunit